MHLIKNLDDFSLHVDQAEYVNVVRDFFKTHDYSALTPGEKKTLSHGVTVVYIVGAGSHDYENILEAHLKYADLHCTLEGTDRIASKPVETCKEVHKPYNDENDYILYKSVPDAIAEVGRGQYCFIPPKSAHMALYGDCGLVKKFVFKIPV